VQYIQEVVDNATGVKIHHENGQWLFKSKPEVNTSPWEVTRMALIPHGNALIALGNISQQSGDNLTSAYVGMLQELQRTSFGTFPQARVQCNGFAANYFTIPCSNPTSVCWNPIEVLIEQVRNLHIKSHTQFAVSTKQIRELGGGGIVDIPFVKKNVETVEDSFEGFLWLLQGTRDSGEDVELLQYAQVFQQGFKTFCDESSPAPGELIHWAHIQASSLMRGPGSPTPTPPVPVPTPQESLAPTPAPTSQPTPQQTPVPTPQPSPSPPPTAVPGNCGGAWEDCSQSRCCKGGLTCFSQNPWYAQCRSDCPTDWMCSS